MRRSILIGCLLLSACSSVKKDLEKQQLLAVQYPNQFKILANQIAPCFPGKAKSDTVIKVVNQQLPGDTVTNIVTQKDTVTVTHTITKPGQLQTRTITVHDTVINDREEGALEATAKSNADSLAIVKNQYSIAEHKAQHRGLIMWCLIGGIALVIVGRVVWMIYGGGWVSSAKKLI